jgi:apolipoprotein N-acyltransferase
MEGVKNMNILLLVIFTLVGIAGLVYNVDSGVFIGLGLIPWQILKIKLKKKWVLSAIIITTLIGGGYFIYFNKWIITALFIFIQLYNYWGLLNAENE